MSLLQYYKLEQLKKDLENKIRPIENVSDNPDIICPISQEIIVDPVRTPCDHSFDKTYIQQWLLTSKTCPVCRREVSVFDLTTDFSLAEKIKNISSNLSYHNLLKEINIQSNKQHEINMDITSKIEKFKKEFEKIIIQDEIIKLMEEQINIILSDIKNKDSRIKKFIGEITELQYGNESRESRIKKLEYDNQDKENKIKSLNLECKNYNMNIEFLEYDLEKKNKIISERDAIIDKYDTKFIAMIILVFILGCVNIFGFIKN